MACKKKKKKFVKVLPWMKEYTSRQIAPKLFFRANSCNISLKIFFVEKRKENWKKVKLIFNDFPFSDVDINDRYDLKIANEAMKLLKKNKKIKEII